MEQVRRVIELRRSTRGYASQPIAGDTLARLSKYMLYDTEGIVGERVKLQLVEVNPAPAKRMKLDYGLIRNHHTYMLGAVADTVVARMNYGFMMEKAVLKATELGLASCWIGYFDRDYFSDHDIVQASDIPALVVVGYPGESLSFSDKLLRTMVKASRRNDWGELFFENDSLDPLSTDLPEGYRLALDMLRLAPSAGNTQPWRVVYDRVADVFHFYKEPVSSRYEKAGLHDIDMGIALSHFDLVLRSSNIRGQWQITPPGTMHPRWVYMMSWRRV